MGQLNDWNSQSKKKQKIVWIWLMHHKSWNNAMFLWHHSVALIDQSITEINASLANFMKQKWFFAWVSQGIEKQTTWSIWLMWSGIFETKRFVSLSTQFLNKKSDCQFRHRERSPLITWSLTKSTLSSLVTVHRPFNGTVAVQSETRRWQCGGLHCMLCMTFNGFRLCSFQPRHRSTIVAGIWPCSWGNGEKQPKERMSSVKDHSIKRKDVCTIINFWNLLSCLVAAMFRYLWYMCNICSE